MVADGDRGGRLLGLVVCLGLGDNLDSAVRSDNVDSLLVGKAAATREESIPCGCNVYPYPKPLQIKQSAENE